MFTITRIYCDAKGESQFEDVKIPLAASGEIGSLSEKIPAKEVMFRKVEPTYDYDFHNAKSYCSLVWNRSDDAAN